MGNEDAFSLVELITAVTIIAIIGAIAYPSYQQYTIRNTEKLVTSKMLAIATQAERWKAKQLNYRDFRPSEISCAEEEDPNDADKTVTVCGTTFCLNDVNDCRYQVTLVDGVDTTKSLSDSSAIGLSWSMLAVPKGGTVYDGKAKKYLLLSSGTRCEIDPTNSTKYNALAVSTTSCTGYGTW